MPTLPAADGAPLHLDITPASRAPSPRESGSERARVGVSVVLVHGWTLDGRIWGPVARALADGPSAARVLRYDHRGHGRSARVDPATMTIEQLADDLAAVIEAAAPRGPLVLGGHSMGGMTIMALAERHPSVLARVRGVALVATASGGLADVSFGLPPRAAAVVRRVEQRMYSSASWAARPALGRPWLLTPAMRWLLLGPGAAADAVRITATVVAECPPATVSGFRPALQVHERDAALAAFASIPTAVMAGTRDRLTPPRYARRIAEALPAASVTIFPGAGHMLPVERASGVADRLAGLVAGARTETPTRGG